MERDGPCGRRLIVVASQDSVGVSEFKISGIKGSPDQHSENSLPPLPRVVLVVAPATQL